MFDLNANHVGYVLAAYGIVALVLVAVVARTLQQAASLKRTLKAMNLQDVGQNNPS